MLDFARRPIVKTGVTKPALRLSCKRWARGHGGARQRAQRPETHNLQTPPKMKTRKILSTDATLIDSDGLISGHGLTVISYPETADEVAQVMIGSTMHRTDDLIVATDRITSKLAGWEVSLRS